MNDGGEGAEHAKKHATLTSAVVVVDDSWLFLNYLPDRRPPSLASISLQMPRFAEGKKTSRPIGSTR
jgi:hypothetical protein